MEIEKLITISRWFIIFVGIVVIIQGVRFLVKWG